MDSNILRNNMKTHRKLHGMTQDELSRKLFISRQALSFYESGTRLPNIYLLWKMADIFEISLDELIGRENVNAVVNNNGVNN